MNLNRRPLRLILGVIAGLAVVPSAAHASLLVADIDNCDAQSLGQVFLPFSDIANYTVAPGGSAESAGDLILSGAASIVAGNEPYYVGDSSDASSLRLPSGSSATTGTMCVGIGHPTMRFFAKSSGTNLFSSLRVDVNFNGILGLQRLTIGTVLPNGSWTLSPTYLVVANLLPLLPGNMTPASFSFTPQGAGTWTVDDIYVDPYRTR
jgi:hypothetical protein